MKNIIFFMLIQISSCNWQQQTRDNKQERYSNKVDSTYYYNCVSHCGFIDGVSGLYLEKTRDIMINFCYYDGRCCYGWRNDYTQMRKIKNPLSEKSLDLLEKDLPKYGISYRNDTVRIKYEVLDSIPLVFYEIVDTRNRFHKTVGKAYLLYENEDIGNFGYNVLVSDTTSEYGYFIFETVIDRIINKSLNPNHPFQKTITIRNKKIGRLTFEKIAPPYRVILPNEVSIKP